MPMLTSTSTLWSCCQLFWHSSWAGSCVSGMVPYLRKCDITHLTLQVDISKYIEISSSLSLPNIRTIACCTSGDIFFPCPMPAMRCESLNTGTGDTNGLKIPIYKTSSYGNQSVLGNFSGFIRVKWSTFCRIPAACWGDTSNRSLVFFS